MEKLERYIILILLAVIVALGGYNLFQKKQLEDEIIKLQNTVAKISPTVEISPGVFEKLALQGDLRQALKQLDSQGEEAKKLRQQLERTHARVVSLSTAVLVAQAKLDELLVGKENPDGSWTASVDRHDGPLFLTGKITAGPTSKEPIHPELTFGIDDLKLDLAISKNPDGSWKADAAVPPPVKLTFTGVHVDPKALQPRFPAPVFFSLQGLGNSTDALIIAGAGYKWGPLVLQMNVAGGTAGSNHVYYGGGVQYFPWE